MSKHFAVIGNPIEHSLSPVIHQRFAHQVSIELIYDKIKGDDANFEQQLRLFFKQGGAGLNVTSPYKQRAFDLADVHSSRCKLAGAANTLWRQDNQLHADNTDGVGLIRDLTRFMTLTGKNILILGAGGAARGIIQPLLELQPATLTIANRSLENAQQLQVDFPQIQCIGLESLTGQYELILNATSASLTSTTLVLPDNIMSQKPFCYDLAYKLKEATSFVQYARGQKCTAVDGLGMLVEQAAEAFYIWTGFKPSTDPVLEWLRASV